MTRDECVNRILGVSQSIKQKNEGREYINAEIVSKMEKTISKMKSGPPPKKQSEGAAKPAYTYTQMFSDAGIMLLDFAVAVSTGDNSYIMRSKLRKSSKSNIQGKLATKSSRKWYRK